LAPARSLQSDFTQTRVLPTAKDLYPTFRRVDLMERRVEMAGEGFITWKHGIFGLMVLWGLEPGELVSCCPGGTDSL